MFFERTRRLHYIRIRQIRVIQMADDRTDFFRHLQLTIRFARKNRDLRRPVLRQKN